MAVIAVSGYFEKLSKLNIEIQGIESVSGDLVGAIETTDMVQTEEQRSELLSQAHALYIKEKKREAD